MIRSLNLKQSWIYIIPGIVIIWSMILLRISGPFFISRIDPDYIYLLNGLNCATLEFSRIGHIDHPGTPFQVLTGIFILFTHLIAGQGPIVDDVISRPEFYLTVSSFYLTLISAIILVWLGKLVLKNENDIIGAVILQSSLLVNIFLIDLPCRYIPDRMLSLVAIAFTGFCVKYFYSENYSARKFAIHSGIIIAIGFVTKFNFLPILIIPLILIPKIRERLIYILTLAVSSVILFLPVFNKFGYFRSFITSIIKHDGLYGGGSEQIFNPAIFWQNIILIYKWNFSFTIVAGITLVALIFLLLKPAIRKYLKKEFLFFITLMGVVLIGTLITAKHYKEYYIIPVVSLTGFTTYVLLKSGRRIFPLRYTNVAFVLLLMYLVYIPVSFLYKPYLGKQKYNYDNILTADFIENNISPDEYLLIQNTWLSGGMIANGMAYGLSYVAYKHYYYNDFERYYPDVLTFSNTDRPLKYLWMIDADNETILKSGKSILVFSTPGRNTDWLCNYVDSCARDYEIMYQRDTLYKNNVNHNFVIRLKNQSDWHEKLTAKFGFERTIGNSVFSDDEKYSLSGQANLSDEFAANGYYSLMLAGMFQKSPELIIQDFHDGDYIEMTVKRKRNKMEEKGNLVLAFEGTDGAVHNLATGKLISSIHSDWELIRLNTGINIIPQNGILKCYYEYNGSEIEYLDDFCIKHFTEN